MRRYMIIAYTLFFACSITWGQEQKKQDPFLELISSHKKTEFNKKFAPDSIYNAIQRATYDNQVGIQESGIQTLSTTTSTTSVDIPNYTPHSPEVQAFKLYGDIPVGEYTGTPDISIPLYVMKQGDIEVPITLSYHASGIKVDQEATWVGLGWNLNTGGVISQEIMGGADYYDDMDASMEWDDFDRAVRCWYPSAIFRVGHEDGMSGHLWDLCLVSHDSNYEENLAMRGKVIKRNLKEGERDIYHVSLPNGRSFKFVLHPKDHTPIIVGKANNCKMVYDNDNIYIIDEDGIKYVYTVDERYAIPLNYSISSIIDKKGNEINFKYTRASHYSPSINEQYVFNGPGPGVIPYNNHRTKIVDISHSTYLTSIESDSEVIFFSMTSREDRIPGNTGCLSNIKIKSEFTGKEIFNFDFDYSYFIGDKIGGDYLSAEENSNGEDTYIPDNIRKKRLKLLSVVERGSSTLAKKKYSFIYDESKALPYKTSFSSDFWGYYNGAENYSSLLYNHKRTLLPNLEEVSNSSDHLYSSVNYPTSGANRNSSGKYITAGMLKSIQYPTGGIVEFEFEPHTFSNHIIPARENIDTSPTSVHTVNNNNWEFSTVTAYLTIPFTQTVTFEATINFPDFNIAQMLGAGSGLVKLAFTGPPTTIASLVITNDDFTVWDNELHQEAANPNKNITKTLTLTLTPGEYFLASSLPSLIPDQGYTARNSSAGCVRYQLREIIPDTLKSIGGGVRVKKIIKKDENEVLLETINYKYEDETGKTSGKLLAPVIMVEPRHLTVKQESVVSTPGTEFEMYIISSIPVRTHTADGCPTPVGYDRVIKEVVSRESSVGKVVSEFANQMSERMLNRLYMFPRHYNGFLLRRSIYDMNNRLLIQEANEYRVSDIKEYMINMSTIDQYMGPTDCNSAFSLYAYLGRFLITMYPSSNYWVDLLNRSQISYLGGVPVVDTEEYSYNSMHQVSSIKKSTSESATFTEESFMYSADVLPSDMKDRNILTPVILYTESRGEVPLKSIYNHYGDYQDKFALLSTTEQTGATTGRTINYKYDIKCNPVEVTYQNRISEVYLWGYNYTYLIAHIKNATYETIKSRMGDNLAVLCSSSSPDITILNNLRTLFPESLVTTWLYDPLIGITKRTDPNGVNTHYEYDPIHRLKDIYIEEQLPSSGIVIPRKAQSFEYNYRNQ